MTPRPQRLGMAVPGECHPAYLDRYGEIVDADLDVFVLPVYDEGPGVFTADPQPPTSPTFRTRQLRRQRAAQSLEPRYGAYVWHVWVDELGRQVAEREAEWIESPASIGLPTYNAGRTWRWVDAWGEWIPDRRTLALPGLTL